MKYRVDVVRIRENYITLNGWAIGRNPGSEATFSVEDEAHRPLPFKLVRTRRDDVIITELRKKNTVLTSASSTSAAKTTISSFPSRGIRRASSTTKS